MGGIFGLVSALPMLLTFFGTEEREDYSDLDKPTLWESIKSVWKNIPFRYGLGIFLATWISVDILQSSLFFYVKYVVQREAQNDHHHGDDLCDRHVCLADLELGL